MFRRLPKLLTPFSRCSILANVNRMGGGVGGGSGQRRPPPPQNVPPPRHDDVDMDIEGGANATPPPPPTRPAPPKFMQVEEGANGLVTISLLNKPVNSLGLDVFSELTNWLRYLGYDESCKSIILTSAIPKVFSAGLDINELRSPKEERFTHFWALFQECWLMMHSFPKPLVAAINGNSPAGGCVLALGCDIRVMARGTADGKDYRIGLNEVRLGMVPPPWVIASFSYVVGQRKAEKMLQLGETPTATEALAAGLVDYVVDEAAVMEVARKEAERLMAIAPQARYLTRDMMRRELTQFLSSDEERQYDTKFFFEMLSQDEVKASIEQYLARLGGKK